MLGYSVRRCMQYRVSGPSYQDNRDTGSRWTQNNGVKLGSLDFVSQTIKCRQSWVMKNTDRQQQVGIKNRNV